MDETPNWSKNKKRVFFCASCFSTGLRVCMWKQLPLISVQGTSSMVELIRRIQENGTHRFRCSKTGELRKRQRFFFPRPGLGTHTFVVPLLVLWYPKDAPFLHRSFHQWDSRWLFFSSLKRKETWWRFTNGLLLPKDLLGALFIRFFSGGNHPVTFRWINDPQTAKPRRWTNDKKCGDCKGLFWKNAPPNPKKSEKLNHSLFKKTTTPLQLSISRPVTTSWALKEKWRVRVACMWGWRIHPWSLTDSSPLKKWGFGRWSW